MYCKSKMTWNSANLFSKVRNICKIFSLVPSKNRENWEKPGVYFWMIKFTRTQILPNCRVPNDFFFITVNFIIQKLKSKHLVCLSFLWWQVFWGGTRENIIHILRALVLSHCESLLPLKYIHFQSSVFTIFIWHSLGILSAYL